MNKISVSAEEVPLPSWAFNARIFAEKALSRLGRDGWDVSILFCNNAFIRLLNKKYREKDFRTDVLSFCCGEKIIEDGEERFIAGDIVISLEALAENSASFNVGEDEELRRLLIHGLLHLDGHDHIPNDIDAASLAASPMLALQEEILASLNAWTIKE